MAAVTRARPWLFSNPKPKTCRLDKMMTTTAKNFLYLIRYAYRVTDSFPFTQEIVLILLGTLATIFITALLLNKQTAVEIEKEQSVLYINLKTTTYQELLALLEEMALKQNFTTRELTRLQFVTHKLAIIASTEVIDYYQGFLDVIRRISADDSFSGDEPELHESLSNLTIQIRRDILGASHARRYTEPEISAIIRNNSKTAMLANSS